MRRKEVLLAYANDALCRAQQAGAGDSPGDVEWLKCQVDLAGIDLEEARLKLDAARVQ